MATVNFAINNSTTNPSHILGLLRIEDFSTDAEAAHSLGITLREWGSPLFDTWFHMEYCELIRDVERPQSPSVGGGAEPTGEATTTGQLVPLLQGLDLKGMIREATIHPAKPVLEGLFNANEIVGLHGSHESFKTIFCLQMMKALSEGGYFLGEWKARKKYRCYLFETEMSVSSLGRRLKQMFPDTSASERLLFASEAQLRLFKRARNLEDKMGLLKGWVKEQRPDVVLIDTANPMFRGQESANDENTVGKFFDLLETLPCKVQLFTRHNRKPFEQKGKPGEVTSTGDESSKIRGSGQFGDVSDLLLYLDRSDKRLDCVTLSLSKYRHGRKPDPIKLWFDSQDFMLIPYSPVVHLLRKGQLSRTELLTQLKRRFNVSQKHADDPLIKELRDLDMVSDVQQGHSKVFMLDFERIKQAEWYQRFSRYNPGPAGVSLRDIQDCISLTETPTPSNAARETYLDG